MDITVKDMMVLIALENYESRYYKDHKFNREVAQNEAFEGLFAKEVERVLGTSVEDNELKGIVIRLNRTGCYTMMGWRNGPAKDCCLTDLYFRLKTLVQNDDGNFITWKKR